MKAVYSVDYRSEATDGETKTVYALAENEGEARAIAFGVLLDDMKRGGVSWFEIDAICLTLTTAPAPKRKKG